MQQIKNRDYIFALICSLSGIFIFILLTYPLYFPIGNRILDASGDGLKNLYTFAYYLKYGNGFTFNGLLYPFGEVVTYMDAQPLYVWIIWFLESTFHFHIENPIIYIHAIILINIQLAFFFIFLILRHFKTGILVSFLASIIIVLLSPQIYRSGDHFALASVAVIPFFWWCYLKISNKQKIHYFIYATGLVFIGFIHPYLILMVVMLLFFYEIIKSIFTKKLRPEIILPIYSMLLFYSILKIIDTKKDRPTTAWGAKEFACKIYDLLLPLNGWLKDYCMAKFPSIIPYYTEGHAYITIFGFFAAIYSVLAIYKLLYKKQTIQSVPNNDIIIWLSASIPILCFAFYIPFAWNEDLFAIINPFKQFRGTGRFVVVFYFVYLVYSTVVVNKILKNKNKLVNVIMLLALLITMYDVYNSSKYLKMRYDMYGKENVYNFYKEYTNKLFSNIKDINKYESIIVYPPSTEGTEKLWIDNDWTAKINSFWVSYFSGLPMANVHSSRVSFDDCMKIYQLSGFYNMPKNIIDKFNPEKKQLILLKNERLQDDIPLIKNAHFVNSVEDISLLEIDLSTLRNTDPTKTTWIDTSYTFLAKNNFNTSKDTCLLIQKNTDVLNVKLNETRYFKSLRILFWYTPNLIKNSSVPICSMYSIDKHQEQNFIKDWREIHTNTYNFKDNWLCVDYELPIDSTVKNILFKLDGNNFYVDNFEVYGR